jgi:hypothetical protein
MIINGDINLKKSYIKSLGNLKEVNGNLLMYDCLFIESLGKLEKISNRLFLSNCINLKSLGKLKEIRYLDLIGCKSLNNLGELEKVTYKISLRNSGITIKHIENYYPQFLNQCDWS